LKSLRLLFWSAIAYSVLLLFVTGLFPTQTTSTIPLTAIPLIVITVIIVRDLARRSTSSTVTKALDPGYYMKGNPVQFLSGQIRVAANASDSYFEDVVRARLKELLIMKVALETGLETETVRQVLSNPRKGPDLLSNKILYTMLYGPIPPSEGQRMQIIQSALELIGAWQG
jgi:hypothetical protein